MRKLLIILAIVISVCTGIYLYAYKGHRNIDSEDADFTITVKQLQTEFKNDAVAANTKFADKTILINGSITTVDKVAKTIMIDNVLSATFSEMVPELSEGQNVTVKSRFVGYDDLLEEFRTDQASIH